MGSPWHNRRALNRVVGLTAERFRGEMEYQAGRLLIDMFSHKG